MRMEESGPARKALCPTSGGVAGRKRGRQKLRWCEALEEDVARVGCRNWKIMAQSRQEWRSS
jgi:hypothetical protein